MSGNHLKDNCVVLKQKDKDQFVGVKIDNKNVRVFFPVGYNLPKEDLELRKDILHLFNILHHLKDDNESVLPNRSLNSDKTKKFPFNAYIEVIRDYIENGYYVENESIYTIDKNGNIDWSKTIKSQKPLLQKNTANNFYSPIYTSFIVKQPNLNENNEISYIHQYCVYESFDKLGWLFTSFVPQKPNVTFNRKRFLSIIRTKLYSTNNDAKKRLFNAMIDVISYMDEEDDENQFYFGTNSFEHVWEKLIDYTFGINDKDRFFPKAEWKLQKGKTKSTFPLQPDTIMIYNGNVYVIDAKYYKYGETNDPSDLPNSASINKQITYGEYIKENYKNLRDDEFDDCIYNAFLMPYNMKDNLFDFDEPFVNIGVAVSKWKENDFKFESIQGILVDIRYLMHCYNKRTKSNIIKLAEVIEESYLENKKLLN